jgi:hypothetical protein
MSRLSLFLVAAFALVCILFAIEHQDKKNIKDDLRSSQNLHALANKKAELWRDKEGKSHARATIAESNLEVAKTVLGDEMKSLIKEVSGLKKNLKNLESYINVNLATSGSISTGLRDTVLIHDSTKTLAKAFSWEDKWTNINGIITDTNLELNYRVRDSLTFVTYWKKNGLFKKPSLMLDAISYNPNSTITGIRNVKITTQPRRKPRLGFYLGYGVSLDGRIRPSAGVGLVY